MSFIYHMVPQKLLGRIHPHTMFLGLKSVFPDWNVSELSTGGTQLLLNERSFELRAQEEDVFELGGSIDVCPVKIRTPHVRSGEICSAKIGVMEKGKLTNAFAEIGLRQISTAKIGARKVDLREIHPRKIPIMKIGTTQVGPVPYGNTKKIGIYQNILI